MTTLSRESATYLSQPHQCSIHYWRVLEIFHILSPKRVEFCKFMVAMLSVQGVEWTQVC